MSDEERVARAMWMAVLTQADEIGMPVPEDTFDDLHPDDRVRQLRIAHAAIEAHKAALAEAGYVIVPREPTPAMLDAAWTEATVRGSDAGYAWEAMIGVALGF